MITGITFKNFKSFGKDAYFEIKPITLIYGINGTGKSSIIQLLQLLKQSLQNKREAILSPKINSEDSVDLGSYEEFIYRHDKKNKLTIILHGEFDERLDIPFLRGNIRLIEKMKVSREEKEKMIRNKIQENSKNIHRKFQTKIRFDLDKDNNIIHDKINIDIDGKNLIIIEKNSQSKYRKGLLITKKFHIENHYINAFNKFLKEENKLNSDFSWLTYNNKTVRLEKKDAVILKHLYDELKKNNGVISAEGFFNNFVKKYYKSIKDNRAVERLRIILIDINRQFHQHPSVRKDFKAIKIFNKNSAKGINPRVNMYREHFDLNTLLIRWDIDFNKTKLQFLADPLKGKLTNKETLIHDLEACLHVGKISNMGFTSRSLFIDQDFPSLTAQIITDNKVSIKNFISDLKNKNLNNKNLQETFNTNIANKYWESDGFLFKPDRQSIGFHSTRTGKFLPIGYPIDDRLGSYFMTKMGHAKRMVGMGPTNSIFINTQIMNREIFTFFDNVLHLSPQAIKVPRINIFKGTTPSSVGYSGENMPDVLFKQNEIKDTCNKYLKELKIPYQILIQELSRKNKEQTGLYELRVYDEVTKTDVHVSDTGYGISQLLTFMVQLIYSKDKQILMKEEIEAHLHPSWQTKLPNLIVDSLKLSSGKNLNSQQNWILETHSEHLILKIKQMIKNKKLSNSQVAIYYTYKDKKAASSKLDSIKLDENGKFVNKWRDGFFQERLDLV